MMAPRLAEEEVETSPSSSVEVDAKTTVLAALSFIGMVFTGVILFVVPPGRIANWTGWTLIGLTKHQWIGLHDWFSVIFIAASVFHIYLNWIKTYLQFHTLMPLLLLSVTTNLYLHNQPYGCF